MINRINMMGRGEAAPELLHPLPIPQWLRFVGGGIRQPKRLTMKMVSSHGCPIDTVQGERGGLLATAGPGYSLTRWLSRPPPHLFHSTISPFSPLQTHFIFFPIPSPGFCIAADFCVCVCVCLLVGEGGTPQSWWKVGGGQVTSPPCLVFLRVTILPFSPSYNSSNNFFKTKMQ